MCSKKLKKQSLSPQQKSSIWTIIWDVIKYILTLGISHINKRKDRIDNGKSDKEA